VDIEPINAAHTIHLIAECKYEKQKKARCSVHKKTPAQWLELGIFTLLYFN
jgi:hypothetical protein